MRVTSGIGIGVGFSFSFSLAIAIVAKTMRDIGGVSNIVGVACGIGIIDRESSSNLTNGVWLRLSFSFSLAIVAIGMSITHSSDHTWVVKTTIKSSIVKWQTSSNLANGPGLSLTLAIMKTIDSSVANGTISIGYLPNGVWVTTDAGNSSKDNSNYFHLGNL